MDLVYVALFVHMVRCIDIQFEIKSFDIQLETLKGDYKYRSLTTVADRQYSNHNFTNKIKFRNSERNITDEDCPSQVSEKKQVEAVLSDMTNQLTRVFTEVNHYIITQVTKVTRKFLNAELIRRALQSRFKISNNKRNLVFDEIFNNMSQSYRNFYNSTPGKVFRTDREDCHVVLNQRIWNLLEFSLLNLRKALRHCMAEYLKEQTISPESELGKNVNELLITKISQIRSKQLDLLCEKFQFCNGTVLQEFMWNM